MATFFNQATLSYNDTVTNSNIVTGELVEVLTASKIAVSDNYSAGETVTYLINIVNSGSSSFTGVTITDDLGAYEFGSDTVTPLTYVDGTVRYFVNGDQTAAPAVTAGPPLVISGITVPANGNVLIAYEARVNGFAPPEAGGEITNTALITAAGLTNPVSVSETITAVEAARLTITKSLSPETVVENGELTYTFIIQNTGNQPVTAADEAAVTDLFNPILNLTAVTFNGTAWTEPANYLYNEVTGLFRTVPGQITVPAATYEQDPETGVWVTQPGISTLVVRGTV